jgi:error-prone DNA polymerase
MAHFIDPKGPHKQPEPPPLKVEAPSGSTPPYAELTCATNFSFLRGASRPRELVTQAAAFGMRALAITDWHTLAGVVRAHGAAKTANLKILVGARIEPRDAAPLCLYARDRKGYANLCRLLTQGKRRAPKGQCDLALADIAQFSAQLEAIALCRHDATSEDLLRYREVFGGHLSLAIMRHLEPDDDVHLRGWDRLAQATGVAQVVVNDVHMHDAARKPLQDTLTCVRHGKTIDEAGGLLFSNAERHIKSPEEMYRLFAGRGQALARSVEIAQRCTFSMDELRYEYPVENIPAGMTSAQYLRQESFKGARERFAGGVPAKVEAQLEKELALIAELGYESYFLTVYEIMRFARGRGILCQGRGSAANSAVCFCLRITEVDPDRYDILFERFISRERAEPPDIDVDFEHERREEVIQHIYSTYSRERAGLCATVISYRTRSAIRDVGKAMGLSLDQVDRLAKSRQWFDEDGVNEMHLREAGIDPADKRVRMALELTRQVRGFPRHLSQHVGGMVMTRGRLDELVPIENAAMQDRTVIEWDKNDIDELGILKVDCLALGMLTAVHKSFDIVRKANGPELSVPAIMATEPHGQPQPPECRALYEMLQRADAVGTFQVESRAQMSMLPRLKPEKFWDLVVEVAIVRPGPIQGGMVHPYLRRRAGEEPADIPYEPLRAALKETFGIPIFQEQAMSVAVIAGGFTPGEADQLRKSMGRWQETGEIIPHIEKLRTGMRRNHIPDDYIEQLLKQIQGFGQYGFPQSHAASFAIITFVSVYLKRFHPAALTASLINSQPMGFYSVSSLVRDAREHGVEVRPIDINASEWDCTLECAGPYQQAPLNAPPETWGKAGPAIRLGLRQVRGFSEEIAKLITAERDTRGAYASLHDLEVRVSHSRLGDAMQRLARADAFASLQLSRREALWNVRGMNASVPEMFVQTKPSEPAVPLPAMSEEQAMVADYNNTGLSLKRHPMEFWREHVRKLGAVTGTELVRDLKDGDSVCLAGRVISRQRPGEGKLLFFSLEDETAVMNLMISPAIFEKYRAAAMSHMIMVKGRVQRKHNVTHVKVNRIEALNERQTELKLESRDFH